MTDYLKIAVHIFTVRIVTSLSDEILLPRYANWSVGTIQECYELFWINPEMNIWKKKQLYGHLPPICENIQDEQGMLNITGEVKTNS